MASPAPDHISSLGFGRAPVSRFLIIGTGISSVSVALLPRRYQNLFSLHWLDIINKKQVWRLATSQLVLDNTMDVLSNCILIYYFLILERRFGSLKYMTFIFKTWSLTLALYLSIMKFNLLEGIVNKLEIAPSGLYGPLYAALVQYFFDVPKGESVGPFGLPISRKIFVYIIALQMLLTSPTTLLISTCGLISGFVYRLNLFSFQHWHVPKGITDTISSVVAFLFPTSAEESDTVSKRVCMGATAEIHEDMVFDHMLRRQQQVHWRGGGGGGGPSTSGRTQSGQGYSDVINPTFLNFLQQPPPPQGGVEPPPPVVPPRPSEVSDEKVNTLVDMGFSRDDVINALASSNNDVQQATSILLAP